MALPATWDASVGDERGVGMALLAAGTQEYETVAAKFKRTLQPPNDPRTTILEVHRIQNEGLWLEYKNRLGLIHRREADKFGARQSPECAPSPFPLDTNRPTCSGTRSDRTCHVAAEPSALLVHTAALACRS